MALMQPGTLLDGFVIGECVHAGGMAHVYRVTYAQPGREVPFPLAMKVPRMSAGDGPETIVSFEVELQMLRVLDGPHVPRFVAAGDLARVPYLVMEYVEGAPLQRWLDDARAGRQRPRADEIAALGAAVATAAHSLHVQEAVHLDIKPANVLIRPDGRAVLLDFGLSWHAHYPDLLAEETRLPVGSAAWMAPEQVVGIRGDPRSDIFAIGVMLYELACGELPFGDPQTRGGLRQRLWMEPVPPRVHAPSLPAWLQQVILRCLEPEADRRYQSAAQLAFDLVNPQQVALGPRAQTTARDPLRTRLRRWLRAAGMHYEPSPLPSTRIQQAPIVMVAVPWKDVSDAAMYSLRMAAERSLGSRPDAQLACVTVVDSDDAGHGPHAPHAGEHGESNVHRHHLQRLRQWAAGLKLDGRQASFHVLESGDTAGALLTYARLNAVTLIILGAATHGLKLQRLIATVPMRVAMEAPCSVLLVKQQLPFEKLGHAEEVHGKGNGDNRA